MHERIPGLYEEHAAAFDGQRSRNLMERRWLERFAALLPGGAHVLDVGCGMGEPVAGWLIGRGYKVTGLDIAPSMLAFCRERFPEQEWLEEDMRAFDLARRFDGIVAWHSAFHLTRAEQRVLVPRFAAHARPGAPLMFTTGPEDGERIGEWQGEPLYHASLAPDEYRRLLDASGFELVAHRAKDPECGDATVWLARLRGPGC